MSMVPGLREEVYPGTVLTEGQSDLHAGFPGFHALSQPLAVMHILTLMHLLYHNLWHQTTHL